MAETLASRITPIHGIKGAKRWGYISRQKTIRLATTDEDGGIYLSPLWFVVHEQRISCRSMPPAGMPGTAKPAAPWPR